MTKKYRYKQFVTFLNYTWNKRKNAIERENFKEGLFYDNLMINCAIVARTYKKRR